MWKFEIGKSYWTKEGSKLSCVEIDGHKARFSDACWRYALDDLGGEFRMGEFEYQAGIGMLEDIDIKRSFPTSDLKPDQMELFE